MGGSLGHSISLVVRQRAQPAPGQARTNAWQPRAMGLRLSESHVARPIRCQVHDLPTRNGTTGIPSFLNDDADVRAVVASRGAAIALRFAIVCTKRIAHSHHHG